MQLVCFFSLTIGRVGGNSGERARPRVRRHQGGTQMHAEQRLSLVINKWQAELLGLRSEMLGSEGSNARLKTEITLIA